MKFFVGQKLYLTEKQRKHNKPEIIIEINEVRNKIFITTRAYGFLLGGEYSNTRNQLFTYDTSSAFFKKIIKNNSSWVVKWK